MPFADEKFLLTGLHRSGTTWLSHIIEKIGQIAVVHEPFNRSSGLRGVPRWYVHHPGREGGEPTQKEAKIAEALLFMLFQGRAKYVWHRPESSFIRNMGRFIFGSRAERQYKKSVRYDYSKVLLKDPFCLFLVPYILEQYHARVIFLTRHPAAHLASMSRMRWYPPLESITQQTLLRDNYAYDVPIDKLSYEMPLAEANSYFWIVANRFIRSVKKKFPYYVSVVKHENVTLNPEDELPKIMNFLNVEEEKESAIRYAQETTSGTIITPSAGKLHEFNRDGQALVRAWKKQLSKKEIAIVRSIVEIDDTFSMEYEGTW